MADATSQPNTNPNGDGSTPPAADGTPAPAPAPAPAAPAKSDDLDLSKLTGDQLNKVLENQELWNLPRIKELREKAAEADKLKTAQETAANDKLVADKKFEELSQKQGTTITELKTQIQTMNINQALTNLLVKENVVDLDGALKLVDRTKISVDDNGEVQGADAALESLKSDKAYLFTGGGTGTPKPTVGTPSNPAAPQGGSGQFKFKESQLTPAFYKEHQAEIDEAGRLGLIEPDGPPQTQ